MPMTRPLAFCICVLLLAGCDDYVGGGSPTPSLAITATPDPVPAGATVAVTFTTNEAVTGLTSAAVLIANGTRTAFSQTDATHYAMTVTAGVPGTLTITVPANAISDAAQATLPQAAVKTVTIYAAPPNAPWASAQGVDGYGAWADLTVTGAGATASQRLRWMAAGSFAMGSPGDEPGHNVSGQETLHQVTLSQGFWLADSPCSQRLWLAVMNARPASFTAADASGLDLPVETVSWDGIQGVNGFLASLTALAPTFPGALPTEAQWEYACRAGTATALSSGDITILGTDNAPAVDTLGWYAGNSGVYGSEIAPAPLVDSSLWPGKQYRGMWYDLSGTHHPKLKLPNAWGLYDMIGDVWEWCADRYQDDLGNAAAVDPAGPAAGASRVLRGGGWMSPAAYCRSAARSPLAPASARNDTGFRLCASGAPRVAPAPAAPQ